MRIWIQNVRTVDHKTDTMQDVLFENGRIAALFLGDEPQADVVIDGRGLVLMPSFVDLHAHFRDPGYTQKETLETGAKAALRGGFTAVCTMANTNPICDTIERWEEIQRRSEALDLIDQYQILAVTVGFDGKTLTDLKDVPDGLRFLSDDGKGILSNQTMLEACYGAVQAKLGIMIHAEDPDLSPVDYRVAEEIITIRDLYLAGYTGAKLHMSHVSTKGCIEAIRIAKEQGVQVTCEVSPHHISLYDLDYRVNPPIRRKGDVEAIIYGIQDGTVDAIATDHAPHTPEDKAAGAPGMVGLETAFALCYTHLVEPGYIDLKKLSQLLSRNPGRILGMDHGEIEVGKRADLVLVDLAKTMEVVPEDFASKCRNTPFEGMKLSGEIVSTFRNGIIKYSRRDGFDH
ncbi:MAG: dihydroorotase [Tissierellia bacterium]|nr:dihydroorotase [Tissierellia bacterium]